jgi:long-subunit acyl-CoA synthetase (AMP-forming)
MSDARGTAADAASLDTFPRLLMQHARQRPSRPAMREKEYGIWQTYTWAEVADKVRAIAGGLAELGFAAATAWRWWVTTGRACTGRWRPASAWAASR